MHTTICADLIADFVDFWPFRQVRGGKERKRGEGERGRSEVKGCMHCERLQFGLMHRFGQLEYDKAKRERGNAAKL